jgi:hypothetical protein
MGFLRSQEQKNHSCGVERYKKILTYRSLPRLLQRRQAARHTIGPWRK